MSSVIVVGNGTSVVDHPHGETIDQFDVVVRFNSYTIKGYEQYTGTKTNIWYTCLFCRERANRLYDEIVVHTWAWDKEKDKTYQKFLAAGLRPHKTVRSDIDEMCDFAGNTEYRTFSTGLIAIHRLLKVHPAVVLVGFDWWDRTEHHYADRQPRGHNHKPSIEYEFINKLVHQGRVSFL